MKDQTENVLGVVIWTGLVVGTLLETVSIRKRRCDWMGSHATRVFYRVHTKNGRAAFILSWAALTAWFIPHILNDPRRQKPVPPKESPAVQAWRRQFSTRILP